MLEDLVSSHQCLCDENARNEEIVTALDTIESGKEFAFYNLNLYTSDMDLLARIDVNSWNNIVLNSKVAISYQGIKSMLLELEGVSIGSDQIEPLSHLIERLTSTILGQSSFDEFELTIRTRGEYKNEKDCIYWHLDKNHKEVYGKDGYGMEKRFIMPLIGVGTSYKKINDSSREKFITIAEEFSFYYGHSLSGCIKGDEISTLLTSSEVYKTEIGFGSVHVASTTGAMHAEPNDIGGRLLLIITTFQ